MKLTNFKTLISLVLILGLFLASCDDATNPVESDLGATKTLKKQEFRPTLSQAKSQTESVLNGVMGSFTYSLMAGNNFDDLTGLSSGINYSFLNGWHTWNGDIEEVSFEDPDVLYELDYVSQVQFQDGSNTVQATHTGAQFMFMRLNQHGKFAFVTDDPRGDEVWFNYQGGVTSLQGNPSTVSILGNYERRWIGDFSEDGENWELIELHYNVNFLCNSLEFFYDWANNDFRLNGVILFNVGTFNIVATFNNSREAFVEIYGLASPNIPLRKQIIDPSVLIDSYVVELPNFYDMFNLPSMDGWNYNLVFAFPEPIKL